MARDHPIIRRAARSEPQHLLAALQANHGALMKVGITFVVGVLTAAQPSGRRQSGDLQHIADTVGRLFSSFLILPSVTFDLGDDDAVRDYARVVIAPLMLRSKRR